MSDQSDAGRDGVIEECARIVSDVWKAARTKPVGTTAICEQILERFAAIRALASAPSEAPKPPGQEPGGDPGVGRGEGDDEDAIATIHERYVVRGVVGKFLSTADRDAIRESATTMMQAFYEARGGHFADGLSAKAETAYAKITAALALIGEG